MQNSLPLILLMQEQPLQQTNPEIAFNLAETGHHLLAIAQFMGSHLKNAGSLLLYGGAKGTKMYIEQVTNLFVHPIDTMRDSLLTPFIMANEAFSAAYIIAFGEHEEREELWETITGIGTHLYQNPDDAIALGMQIFLPCPGQLAINRIAKHCKGSSLIKAIADSSCKNEFIKKQPNKLYNQLLI